MNACVIPARSGSKRLPGKNVKLFFGRPVLWYAIDTAYRTGLFSRVMVSSDSQDIGRLAQEYGAEWHHRSARTSDDGANDYAVIQEVLKTVKPDYLCYLYPITPLLEPVDLLKGYDMMLSHLWPVVRSTMPNGKDAGAFYWLDCGAEVSEYSYYNEFAPLPLPEFNCHDVNTLEDWQVMAAKYAAKWVCT